MVFHRNRSTEDEIRLEKVHGLGHERKNKKSFQCRVEVCVFLEQNKLGSCFYVNKKIVLIYR